MDLELRGLAVTSDPPLLVGLLLLLLPIPSLEPPDRLDILVRGSLLLVTAPKPGLCIPFMPFKPPTLLTKPLAAGLFSALQLTAPVDVDDEAL